MPSLGEPSAKRLVCIDCLNLSDVRQLLQGFLFAGGDDDRFWESFEQLRLKIGFSHICLECLYEKTGIDRRKRDSSGGIG
jgi:hypothetical protein